MAAETTTTARTGTALPRLAVLLLLVLAAGAAPANRRRTAARPVPEELGHRRRAPCLGSGRSARTAGAAHAA